jgi:hypothetical protein
VGEFFGFLWSVELGLGLGVAAGMRPVVAQATPSARRPVSRPVKIERRVRRMAV